MPNTIQKGKISQAVKMTGHIIDQWMPPKMSYGNIPGISVSIVHDSHILYEKGFGFADVKRKEHVKPSTLFRVASMSKMFTAVSILQLQEQGKLKLTDKVSKHVPWVTGKTPHGDLSGITIKQILSHTSGLFRDGEKPYWSTHKFPKTLKGTLSARSLIYPYPNSFKYSNHAYSLLGEVIEKASGLSYGDYVQKNIIDTVALKSTYPDLSVKAKSRLAVGYGRIIPGKKERTVYPSVSTQAYAPATGIISSASDIGIFLSDVISSKSKLLQKNSREILLKASTKIDDGGTYGIGMEVVTVKKHKTLGHSGGFRGFITKAGIDPETGVAVVVLANTLAAPSGHLYRGIFELLYYCADQISKKKPNFKSYEGIYRDDWGDDLIVGIGNNLVSFDVRENIPLSNKAVLKPIGKDSFRIEGNSFGARGEKAVFSKFIHGKATKLLSGADPSKRVIF